MMIENGSISDFNVFWSPFGHIFQAPLCEVSACRRLGRADFPGRAFVRQMFDIDGGRFDKSPDVFNRNNVLIQGKNGSPTRGKFVNPSWKLNFRSFIFQTFFQPIHDWTLKMSFLLLSKLRVDLFVLQLSPLAWKSWLFWVLSFDHLEHLTWQTAGWPKALERSAAAGKSVGDPEKSFVTKGDFWKTRLRHRKQENKCTKCGRNRRSDGHSKVGFLKKREDAHRGSEMTRVFWGNAAGQKRNIHSDSSTLPSLWSQNRGRRTHFNVKEC